MNFYFLVEYNLRASDNQYGKKPMKELKIFFSSIYFWVTLELKF